MCGIFGYLSKKGKAIQRTLDGLEHLEYRGYDSAGIAAIDSNGKLCLFKEVGKVHKLKYLIGDPPPTARVAIGHTRWATNGKPSALNAHPHCDQEENIALVHNGIIENHAFLRKFLWEKGIEFSSETDTEVIVQLIAYFFKGDLVKAVQQATQMLEGFWAIALIDQRSPEVIVAAAQGNPLVIGLSSTHNEALLSSDPQAFARSDLNVYFLKDGEVATLKHHEVQFFDASTSAVEKSAEQLDIPPHVMSKGGYPHFMLKEISEQPHALQSALHSRFLLDYGTAQFEHSLPDALLKQIDRILILGCGTSWHAGSIGMLLFESVANIPTQVEIASEFRTQHRLLSPHTLVIALSQSGETLDTLAAIRELKAKGFPTLAICNCPNSALVREADSAILQRSGPEVSVCSTKSFTSCLTILSLLALQMGRLRSLKKKEGKEFLTHLLSLPALAEQVIKATEEIKSLAAQYVSYNTFFFLGRHYMYPTCLEAALKLKEISYLNATGYPAGELKHGPIALIDDEVATVGLCGNGPTLKKLLSNLQEVKARGGRVLAMAPARAEEVSEIADDLLILPETIDALSPILYSIACQLFAYHVALLRGTDIDQPRNLAKSVTVE